MVAYKVQVVLKTSDGNPENYCTNTWACAGVDVVDLGLFVTELRTFYGAMRAFYPAYIVQNGHDIKGYDMSDPEPRAPVLEQVFNFASAPTGNPLPLEVALCMSFQGPKLSGVPQARRRGRIYFGPVNATQIATDGRPAATLIAALAAAGDALVTASGGPGTWDWAVYSTISGGTTSVTNGWVDNEWDTQRRRGRRSTARTTFS